nr:hypothetical protein DM860_018267 [Ipomoea batatas]
MTCVEPNSLFSLQRFLESTVNLWFFSLGAAVSGFDSTWRSTPCSAPLLSNSVQEESRHGDRIFSPASQHGMETVPAWQLLFASQTQLPATLVGSTLQQARAPSQHTSPVVDGGVSGAAASHSAGGVSVPLALPQFGPPQSLQQGVPRHALNSGLNGGQMLSQQTGGAHVVGGFMQASQQTTTTPFPHNVAIVVHGANGLNNSPNQAHVIGGDIQGPNGDGVQLQRITLPANVQGNVLPSVVHANMEKTLPSVVHDGGTAVTHGNVSLLNNATIGHSLPPIAPNASNPSALHELNSLHNANTPIMNTPTVALGNDISLNNANANLPNVTVPTVALGSNLSLNNANLPSVAVGGTMAHSLTNPNIAKNVPSATVGVSTAHPANTTKNISNNLARQRVNIQPSGSAPKSFAQLFTASNPGGHNVSIASPIPMPIISEKIVETHRGEPFITFEDNEIQQMNKIENIMLVGKFSHGKPLLSEIRSYFAKTFVLRGTVEIGLMDPRHVFLAFSNPDDCVDIFVKGQISFNGKYLMRLFRWTADFDTRFETSLAPVMGSKRPGKEDEGFWQPIEYEKVPPYCLTCKKQGHLPPTCRSRIRRSGPTVGPEQPLLPAPLPQVGVGVGTSTNPLLGSQPVAPIHISTCNTFTLLQDVNETVLAEGAHTQEVVHDTTLANQAHTQEATTKDFDADLDDHLAKVLGSRRGSSVTGGTSVEDNSTHGDASSAAPTSLGLQTPVREHGIGLEASDDDDDNNSSVAGRVAIFESAGSLDLRSLDSFRLRLGFDSAFAGFQIRSLLVSPGLWGDFNCLLNVDEKKGGLPYPHRKTTNFRECVSTCDLIDSTAYGSSFTWWKWEA